MTLERAIALLFMVLCVAYGYSAFVTMQENFRKLEEVAEIHILPDAESIVEELLRAATNVRP